MNIFRQAWEAIFPPVRPLPAGVYQYQTPPDAPYQYRLHLRIEPDGRGVLIVNASTIIQLNPTAAEYAYHLVHHTGEEQAIESIARRYQVRKEIVRRDWTDMQERLNALVAMPDLDPVSELNFDREEPYTGALSAPYRIDCALTYHLPESSTRPLAPLERVSRELLTEEWQRLLEKAWNAGVPHVIFTGGEPTLRPDLPALVAHAEKLGMVAGLITNGLRLSEKQYLHDLLQAGLDHVMILLDPLDEQAWEALRDVMAEDIAVTVHLTISPHNQERCEDALSRLVEMGVQRVSLSADSLALKNELQALRQRAAELGLSLVWDLPVPYSNFHPVAVELAEELPNVDAHAPGAGRGWLYVEPDGDVLPGQGRYQSVLGNLLSDSWEQVWDSTRATADRIGV